MNKKIISLIIFFALLGIVVADSHGTAPTPEAPTNTPQVSSLDAMLAQDKPTLEQFQTLSTGDQLGYLDKKFNNQFAQSYFDDNPEKINTNPDLAKKYMSGDGDPKASAENIKHNPATANSYFSKQYGKDFNLDEMGKEGFDSSTFSFDPKAGTLSNGGKVLELKSITKNENVLGVKVVNGGFVITEKSEKEEGNRITISGDGSGDVSYKDGQLQIKNKDGSSTSITADADANIVIGKDGSYTITGKAHGLMPATNGVIEFNNRRGTLNIKPNGDFKSDNAEIIAPTYYFDGAGEKKGKEVGLWAHGDTNEGNLRGTNSVFVDRITDVGVSSQGQSGKKSGNDREQVKLHLDTVSPTSRHKAEAKQETKQTPEQAAAQLRKKASNLKPPTGDVGNSGEVWVTKNKRNEVIVTAKGKVDVGFYDGNALQENTPYFRGANGKAELDMKRNGQTDIDIRGKAVFADSQYGSLKQGEKGELTIGGISTSQDGAALAISRSKGNNKDEITADCFKCAEGEAITVSKKITIGNAIRGDDVFEAVGSGAFDMKVRVGSDGKKSFSTSRAQMGHLAALQEAGNPAIIGRTVDFSIAQGNSKQTMTVGKPSGRASDAVVAHVQNYKVKEDGTTVPVGQPTTVDFGIKDAVGDVIIITSDKNKESMNTLFDLIDKRKFSKLSEADLDFDKDPKLRDYIYKKTRMDIGLVKDPAYVQKIESAAKSQTEFFRLQEKLQKKYKIEIDDNGQCVSPSDCLAKINKAIRKSQTLGQTWSLANIQLLKAQRSDIDARVQSDKSRGKKDPSVDETRDKIEKTLRKMRKINTGITKQKKAIADHKKNVAAAKKQAEEQRKAQIIDQKKLQEKFTRDQAKAASIRSQISKKQTKINDLDAQIERQIKAIKEQSKKGCGFFCNKKRNAALQKGLETRLAKLKAQQESLKYDVGKGKKDASILSSEYASNPTLSAELAMASGNFDEAIAISKDLEKSNKDVAKVLQAKAHLMSGDGEKATKAIGAIKDKKTRKALQQVRDQQVLAMIKNRQTLIDEQYESRKASLRERAERGVFSSALSWFGEASGGAITKALSLAADAVTSGNVVRVDDPNYIEYKDGLRKKGWKELSDASYEMHLVRLRAENAIKRGEPIDSAFKDYKYPADSKISNTLSLIRTSAVGGKISQEALASADLDVASMEVAANDYKTVQSEGKYAEIKKKYPGTFAAKVAGGEIKRLDGRVGLLSERSSQKYGDLAIEANSIDNLAGVGLFSAAFKATKGAVTGAKIAIAASKAGKLAKAASISAKGYAASTKTAKALQAGAAATKVAAISAKDIAVSSKVGSKVLTAGEFSAKVGKTTVSKVSDTAGYVGKKKNQLSQWARPGGFGDQIAKELAKNTRDASDALNTLQKIGSSETDIAKATKALKEAESAQKGYSIAKSTKHGFFRKDAGFVSSHRRANDAVRAAAKEYDEAVKLVGVEGASAQAAKLMEATSAVEKATIGGRMEAAMITKISGEAQKAATATKGAKAASTATKVVDSVDTAADAKTAAKKPIVKMGNGIVDVGTIRFDASKVKPLKDSFSKLDELGVVPEVNVPKDISWNYKSKRWHGTDGKFVSGKGFEEALSAKGISYNKKANRWQGADGKFVSRDYVETIANSRRELDVNWDYSIGRWRAADGKLVSGKQYSQTLADQGITYNTKSKRWQGADGKFVSKDKVKEIAKPKKIVYDTSHLKGVQKAEAQKAIAVIGEAGVTDDVIESVVKSSDEIVQPTLAQQGREVQHALQQQHVVGSATPSTPAVTPKVANKAKTPKAAKKPSPDEYLEEVGKRLQKGTATPAEKKLVAALDDPAKLDDITPRDVRELRQNSKLKHGEAPKPAPVSKQIPIQDPPEVPFDASKVKSSVKRVDDVIDYSDSADGARVIDFADPSIDDIVDAASPAAAIGYASRAEILEDVKPLTAFLEEQGNHWAVSGSGGIADELATFGQRTGDADILVSSKQWESLDAKLAQLADEGRLSEIGVKEYNPMHYQPYETSTGVGYNSIAKGSVILENGQEIDLIAGFAYKVNDPTAIKQGFMQLDNGVKIPVQLSPDGKGYRATLFDLDEVGNPTVSSFFRKGEDGATFMTTDGLHAKYTFEKRPERLEIVEKIAKGDEVADSGKAVEEVASVSKPIDDPRVIDLADAQVKIKQSIADGSAFRQHVSQIDDVPLYKGDSVTFGSKSGNTYEGKFVDEITGPQGQTLVRIEQEGKLVSLEKARLTGYSATPSIVGKPLPTTGKLPLSAGDDVAFVSKSGNTYTGKFVEVTDSRIMLEKNGKLVPLDTSRLKSFQSLDTFGDVSKVADDAQVIPIEAAADIVAAKKAGVQTKINPDSVRHFEGKPSHKYQGATSNQRAYEKGGLVQVHNSPLDRTYAEANNLIFEGVSPAVLPKGKRYTYVVLENGNVVFGQVDSALEYGVKHSHLANGRAVHAAGELQIAENGKYLFNTESGTFSRQLIKEKKLITAEEMSEDVGTLFNKEFGYSGTITKRTLVPSQATDAHIAEICTNPAFARNLGLCSQPGEIVELVTANNGKVTGKYLREEIIPNQGRAIYIEHNGQEVGVWANELLDGRRLAKPVSDVPILPPSELSDVNSIRKSVDDVPDELVQSSTGRLGDEDDLFWHYYGNYNAKTESESTNIIEGWFPDTHANRLRDSSPSHMTVNPYGNGGAYTYLRNIEIGPLKKRGIYRYYLNIKDPEAALEFMPELGRALDEAGISFAMKTNNDLLEYGRRVDPVVLYAEKGQEGAAREILENLHSRKKHLFDSETPQFTQQIREGIAGGAEPYAWTDDSFGGVRARALREIKLATEGKPLSNDEFLKISHDKFKELGVDPRFPHKNYPGTPLPEAELLPMKYGESIELLGKDGEKIAGKYLDEFQFQDGRKYLRVETDEGINWVAKHEIGNWQKGPCSLANAAGFAFGNLVGLASGDCGVFQIQMNIPSSNAFKQKYNPISKGAPSDLVSSSNKIGSTTIPPNSNIKIQSKLGRSIEGKLLGVDGDNLRLIDSSGNIRDHRIVGLDIDSVRTTSSSVGDLGKDEIIDIVANGETISGRVFRSNDQTLVIVDNAGKRHKFTRNKIEITARGKSYEAAKGVQQGDTIKIVKSDGSVTAPIYHSEDGKYLHYTEGGELKSIEKNLVDDVDVLGRKVSGESSTQFNPVKDPLPLKRGETIDFVGADGNKIKGSFVDEYRGADGDFVRIQKEGRVHDIRKNQFDDMYQSPCTFRNAVGAAVGNLVGFGAAQNCGVWQINVDGSFDDIAKVSSSGDAQVIDIAQARIAASPALDQTQLRSMLDAPSELSGKDLQRHYYGKYRDKTSFTGTLSKEWQNPNSFELEHLQMEAVPGWVYIQNTPKMGNKHESRIYMNFADADGAPKFMSDLGKDLDAQGIKFRMKTVMEKEKYASRIDNSLVYIDPVDQARARKIVLEHHAKNKHLFDSQTPLLTNKLADGIGVAEIIVTRERKSFGDGVRKALKELDEATKGKKLTDAQFAQEQQKIFSKYGMDPKEPWKIFDPTKSVSSTPPQVTPSSSADKVIPIGTARKPAVTQRATSSPSQLGQGSLKDLVEFTREAEKTSQVAANIDSDNLDAIKSGDVNKIINLVSRRVKIRKRAPSPGSHITVNTKGGKKLRGRLVKMDNSIVHLQDEFGNSVQHANSRLNLDTIRQSSSQSGLNPSVYVEIPRHNGKPIKGTFIRQSDTKIMLQDSTGRNIVIEKNKLDLSGIKKTTSASVSYGVRRGDPFTITGFNGAQKKGRYMAEDANYVYLISTDGKKIRIQKRNIDFPQATTKKTPTPGKMTRIKNVAGQAFAGRIIDENNNTIRMKTTQGETVEIDSINVDFASFNEKGDCSNNPFGTLYSRCGFGSTN